MIPYLYFLKHYPTGRMYIGVQYGVKADPSNLWNSYFSSSEHVLSLLELDGPDAFYYKVRKIFEDKEQCIKYETRLLKKLGAADRTDFFNQHNNDIEMVRKYKKPRSKMMWITNEVFDRMVLITEAIPFGWRKGRVNGIRNGPRSDDFKKKMSDIKKGVPLSEEHKRNLQGLIRGMAGKKHSDDTKHKMSVSKKGIKFSDDHKKAMSEARIGKSRGPCSEETKKRISDAKRGKRKV